MYKAVLFMQKQPNVAFFLYLLQCPGVLRVEVLCGFFPLLPASPLLLQIYVLPPEILSSSIGDLFLAAGSSV